MNLNSYICPHIINGFEYRENGSGWSYGTVDNGRGNGNAYYRFTITPGCNLAYNNNLIFKCI